MTFSRLIVLGMKLALSMQEASMVRAGLNRTMAERRRRVDVPSDGFMRAGANIAGFFVLSFALSAIWL